MSCSSIVVLTGAGISAESGVDTFRDPDGLWARIDYRDVATPEGFRRNPALVQDFYNQRRRRLQSVGAKRRAHGAGAAASTSSRASSCWSHRTSTTCTSGRARATSSTCMASSPARCAPIAAAACPGTTTSRKRRPAPLRVAGLPAGPTWSGSARCPTTWSASTPRSRSATCSPSIGTSGNVYPAAGFVAEARQHGARTVELNLEPSEGLPLFHEARHGPATRLVPEWVDSLLAQQGL